MADAKASGQNRTFGLVAKRRPGIPEMEQPLVSSRLQSHSPLSNHPKGQPGIILFQIENEYERVNWFPKDMKKKYLEGLTDFSHRNGIEVPIFTCWTTELRNVKEGPLAGVFYFVNSYPKWQVKKSFDNLVDIQKRDQPDFPLMSAELQGGWYSEVGGQLSRQISGVEPVHTQNLALYAIQRGFSLINFYMLVGGTNFDDWASRETTTTYDFAAAISENGGVGDKYFRLKGIGEMLHEHGTQLASSEEIPVTVVNSDTLEEVAVRRSTDGSRFVFVRTEARDKSHAGTAIVTEKDGTSFAFDYQLEPFGSKVLVRQPSGNTDWYPKVRNFVNRPSKLPTEIVFKKVDAFADKLPQKWTKLRPGQALDDFKVYDRHYVYYKLSVPAGKTFTLGVIGNKKVNNSKADVVLAYANGKLLAPLSVKGDSVSFLMPEGAKEAVLLFENRGLHHHTKCVVEDNWGNGIKWASVDGKPVSLEFASVERERGLNYSSASSKQGQAR